MSLEELKTAVLNACELARDYGQDPKDIQVSLQIDSHNELAVWASKDVELHYDNDGQAMGCVLTALSE